MAVTLYTAFQLGRGARDSTSPGLDRFPDYNVISITRHLHHAKLLRRRKYTPVSRLTHFLSRPKECKLKPIPTKITILPIAIFPIPAFQTIEQRSQDKLSRSLSLTLFPQTPTVFLPDKRPRQLARNKEKKKHTQPRCSNCISSHTGAKPQSSGPVCLVQAQERLGRAHLNIDYIAAGRASCPSCFP